jgi:hypothetical protein
VKMDMSLPATRFLQPLHLGESRRAAVIGKSPIQHLDAPIVRKMTVVDCDVRRQVEINRCGWFASYDRYKCRNGTVIDCLMNSLMTGGPTSLPKIAVIPLMSAGVFLGASGKGGMCRTAQQMLSESQTACDGNRLKNEILKEILLHFGTRQDVKSGEPARFCAHSRPAGFRECWVFPEQPCYVEPRNVN